jgi:hypothetical protein
MGKSSTSFKKGEGGRPVGTKNKSYLDASHWLQRVDELAGEIKDEDKKVSILKWATELVMSKIPAIPSTPTESHDNAIAAQQVINQAIEDQKQKMVKQLENADPAPATNSD